MARARVTGSGWVVAAMLLAVVVGSALIVASCGSGGGAGKGGIDGGLCAQCGDTDGPCRTTVSAPAEDVAELCPGAAPGATCDVALSCFRKLGSAQRVCYPTQFEQFRCDGERAHRPTLTPTATPTLTPTSTAPTATLTPGSTSTALTPTPTPTATAAANLCGNNNIDDGEECDGTLLDDEDCDSLCDASGGTLACTNCRFDFSGCTDPSTCAAP